MTRRPALLLWKFPFTQNPGLPALESIAIFHKTEFLIPPSLPLWIVHLQAVSEASIPYSQGSFRPSLALSFHPYPLEHRILEGRWGKKMF